MTIDPERITVTDFSLKHRVTVHYTGSFEDGEVFDTTIGRKDHRDRLLPQAPRDGALHRLL